MSEQQRPSGLRKASPSCACLQLHAGCNKFHCQMAADFPFSKSWQENDGPVESILLNLRAEEFDRGVANGCVTCAVIRQVAGECARLTVQRSKRLCTIFGQRVYRDIANPSSSHCYAFPAASFPLSLRTFSRAAFSFCKDRLRTCMRDHELCQSDELYRFPMPRRLIKIEYSQLQSSTNNSRAIVSRLVELQRDEELEYITLSHCWGQNQLITTTKETLGARLEHIPWDLLSITFQDALIITSELGFRYIWIDSLCIIQDDHLDWEVESNNMASIYKNSSLTIAASTSGKIDHGCFVSTPDLPGAEVTSPNSRIHTGIFTRRQISHWQNWKRWRCEKGSWPLSTRAWTLQEELLSPRVIYYGPEEVVWQCNTILDFQCGTIGDTLPSSQIGFLDKRLYASVISKKRLADLSVADHQRSLEKQWRDIVTEYCMRQLTKETDRFPALSGLSKQIQAAGLAPLVAGVPANDVLPWLLWKVASPNDSPNQNPSSYTAPSWSWASAPSSFPLLFKDLRASAKLRGCNVEPIAQVVDIAAEPEGLDATGALKSARIVLYAPAKIISFDKNCAHGVHEKYVFGISWDPHRYDEGAYKGEEYLYILIARISRARPTGDSPNTSYGLVLRSVDAKRYERIGYFERDDRENELPRSGFELIGVMVI